MNICNSREHKTAPYDISQSVGKHIRLNIFKFSNKSVIRWCIHARKH